MCIGKGAATRSCSNMFSQLSIPGSAIISWASFHPLPINSVRQVQVTGQVLLFVCKHVQCNNTSFVHVLYINVIHWNLEDHYLPKPELGVQATVSISTSNQLSFPKSAHHQNIVRKFLSTKSNVPLFPTSQSTQLPESEQTVGYKLVAGHEQ